MADNVTLDPGSGGSTIAADDISSVFYPRSKITLGADGVNDGDVSSANPMPVTHAALTELAAAIDTEVQVDIVSSALPSGAATSAKQDSQTALLTTIDSDTSGLFGCVGGTELQVDIVGALPAGTNAIGKLSANSGVDIGDVDVTSLPSTVHSADYDTGGGTDTTLAFGIAVPASGGAAVVPGDATAGLKVDLGADNDVTVTGSVTANAGTNLNTSALALESGGNLAACATSLGTLDNAIAGSEMQVDVVAALPAGTNNIGDVDVASIAAGDNNIGNVDLASAIPAGTNLIGRIAASPETTTVYEGTTALTPKFAKISAASSGENTLVTGVSSKKIRVLSLCLVGVGTAVNIHFKDAASGNAIFADGTNPIPIDKSGAAGAGGLVLGYNPLGWFQTAASGALILNLSGAQAVAGSLTYVEAA